MSKAEVKKIVKKYGEALRKSDFPYSALYIFGSQIRGKSNKWSDIDVAVVSDRFRKKKDNDRLLLWKVRRHVDTRIEPHGFTVRGFANDADPMAYEIRKTGIRVV
ncbi:MAG: nucleotidyltransferase domain-containing protein [Candidatus Kerfeldbacteria bacterium]|nr:nucleotidyltransferase domain-containing protein [Candidatus Kerfeldbacteria bacterium]